MRSHTWAHGGDIYRHAIQLDYSVNVNPFGVPPAVREAMLRAVEHCSVYPDIQAEELKRAIAGRSGFLPEDIICGNGASELFLAIVHAVQPKKAGIVVPSFYGYEYAAKAGRCEIAYYTLCEENGFVLTRHFCDWLIQEPDMELLFLAQPNNPTGRCIPKTLLEEILAVCRERHMVVVLDECFIEFVMSSYENRDTDLLLRENPNLIVVRAFTKIFAVPGVRLGYAICKNQQMKEAIAAQLPEWNVSVFAQAAGIAAAKEKEYVKQTVAQIHQERGYLWEQLKQYTEVRVYEGQANFLLFHSQVPLYEPLLRRNILIRDCSNFRGLTLGYYRIAVRTHEENVQLLENIKEVFRDR